MILKAIGIVIILIALRLLFAGAFESAQTFLQEFFRFGTAVISKPSAVSKLPVPPYLIR